MWQGIVAFAHLNKHFVDFTHAEHAPPTHTKENVEGVFFSKL
jgi:hypothetical protein